MIPSLASLILLEGAMLIMSAGIIKGIFGLIPPVDVIMIVGINDHPVTCSIKCGRLQREITRQEVSA